MAAVLPSVVGEGRLSEGVFGHGRLEEDLLHGGAVARDVAATIQINLILKRRQQSCFQFELHT